MKIVEVRPLVLGTAWRNLTFVVVRTDEGIEGVGEVRMINHTDALLGYLAEATPNHVLGADPFEIEDLLIDGARFGTQIAPRCGAPVVGTDSGECRDL